MTSHEHEAERSARISQAQRDSTETPATPLAAEPLRYSPVVIPDDFCPTCEYLNASWTDLWLDHTSTCPKYARNHSRSTEGDNG